MGIKFITGNKTKLIEAKTAIPNLEQLDIDLLEIQELDAKKIIRHKLQQALKHYKGRFIVEDTSMYMDCLEGKLPGPFVKWFNETIGTQGLYEIAKNFKNYKAFAVTLIGFNDSSGKIKFFEGKVFGKIVKPKGSYLFGFDPIFVPRGKTQTLSELKAKGDFTSSPRGIAFKKLKTYLKNASK